MSIEHLIFIAISAAAGLAFVPHLRRMTGLVHEVPTEALEARDARLLEAIAADDVAAVSGALKSDTTLPADAWAAAVERAHPDIVRLLLPLADPCASLDGSRFGVSTVMRLGGAIHTGKRQDHGVAALAVVLEDPRVTAEAVMNALEFWRLVWHRCDDANADRLAALLEHPSLSVQALADNPDRLAALEKIERDILTAPLAAGHPADRAQALRINRRGADARALIRAGGAKIVAFKKKRKA